MKRRSLLKTIPAREATAMTAGKKQGGGTTRVTMFAVTSYQVASNQLSSSTNRGKGTWQINRKAGK